MAAVTFCMHACSCRPKRATPPPRPMPPTPAFCAPVDRQPYLVVLGVVTTQWSSLRHILRKTWLPSPDSAMVTRLVLRGQDASAKVIEEARAFGDTVFLPSPAAASKATGPLMSTWQWLECASLAWPRTILIGKAEDDIWAHLPSVLHSLRVSAALSDTASRDLYWGIGPETYHWNETSQSPWTWSYWYGRGRTYCRTYGKARVLPDIAGPFPFLKGPLYVLSRALAMRVVREQVKLYRRALGSAGRGTTAVFNSANQPTMINEGQVWEDVFMGYLLDQLDPPPTLDLVHIDKGATELFQEGWPDFMPHFKIANQTMVWHGNTAKNPTRISLIHRYMRRHRCNLASGVTCDRGLSDTCKGRRLRVCSQDQGAIGEGGCTGGNEDYLQVLRSEQADGARLPPPLADGYCSATEVGEGALCDPADVKGTWLQPSASVCVAACKRCSRCNFVSYSALDADCSWFLECPEVKKRPRTGHRTWRVT